MRLTATALALVISSLAFTPAQAGGPAKGVVELFTSQGCSSCPPADAALGNIINQGGMIALAWHVDYWDYLGWKDTFSTPAATARQATYAQRIGGGSYTPEFVVNGAAGSSSSSIVNSGGLSVPVQVDGGSVKVAAGDGEANVFLVNFSNSETVPIQRGENAGHSVTYRHVVTGMRKLASWNGAALNVDVGTGGSCAVILQRPGQGEIIGAAMC